MAKDRGLEQLMVARDVWLRTGVLAQLQLTQLNMWNMCILPHTKRGETHIDQDDWIVEFHLTPEFAHSFRVPKEAQLRCAYAQNWVHKLLDGRVLVRVYWKSALIFEGTRTATAPEITEAGVDFQAGKTVPEKPWVPNPKIKY